MVATTKIEPAARGLTPFTLQRVDELEAELEELRSGSISSDEVAALRAELAEALEQRDAARAARSLAEASSARMERLSNQVKALRQDRTRLDGIVKDLQQSLESATEREATLCEQISTLESERDESQLAEVAPHTDPCHPDLHPTTLTCTPPPAPPPSPTPVRLQGRE